MENVAKLVQLSCECQQHDFCHVLCANAYKQQTTCWQFILHSKTEN